MRAAFSPTRQIKAREALSPPALPAQAARYRGARGNSSESSAKDPAEALSRSEEHPRYSPAAAAAAGDPGDGQGGREQSIQRPPAHLHLQQRAGARRYLLRLCRVVCWRMDFFSISIYVLIYFSGSIYLLTLSPCFIYKQNLSAEDLLPPGDLCVVFFFLLGEKLMQKVQTDETAFSHTCH